ncbi:MAG: hypothetical protein Kow0032_28820 [Methyloligellaceae bacterium]
MRPRLFDTLHRSPRHAGREGAHTSILPSGGADLPETRDRDLTAARPASGVLRVVLRDFKVHASRDKSFEAWLGDECLGRFHCPRLDAARALLALGYPPDAMMTTRHEGKDYDSWKPAPIGALAEWTIEETDRDGLRRRRYREHPQKAVSCRAGATTERDLAVPSGPVPERQDASV